MNSSSLKYSLFVLILICFLSILFIVTNLTFLTDAKVLPWTSALEKVHRSNFKLLSISKSSINSEDLYYGNSSKNTTTMTSMLTEYVKVIKDVSETSSEPRPPFTANVSRVNRYYNLTSSTLSKLVKVHWTSLYGKNDKDSYNFFSAYYDSRTNLKHHRPAVIVMGYVHKEIPEVNFYCVLNYMNGSKSCLKEAAFRQHPSTCFSPVLHAKEFQFFCKVRPGEEPPVSVQLSTSNTCDPKLFSGKIPVKNRINTSLTQTAPKKFGVCVTGPLLQEGPAILKDVIEFVEMSTALGVELIVLYVNETQVDMKVLEYIWNHYPDTIRTIGWRSFEKWYPMHYYGQLLIISDCLYRMMYEVEYLAFIDLDEMIIPVKHNNWAEMVAAFGNNPVVASFRFQNAFFSAQDKSVQSVPPSFNCPNVVLAKYFTQTLRYRCFPGVHYRIKYISRPKYIYEHNIHYICLTLEHHEQIYNVPTNIGILGHYRSTVPDDCIKKPKSPDYVTKRFMEPVTKRICARYSAS